MNTVSICIPCYILDDELKQLTQKCIDSIRRWTKIDYEIIIIDNGSPLKYNEWLSDLGDVYFQNDGNKGNSQAWNKASSMATRDYLCFMDNDVSVTKGWLEPLIESLQIPESGIAFPQSKNREDIHWQRRLDGFCWLIRTELFKAVGHVDEGYGLAYFEDTDYCMRVVKAGYKLISAEKSRVYHYARATADKMPWLKILYLKNQKKYEDKWSFEYPHLSTGI